MICQWACGYTLHLWWPLPTQVSRAARLLHLSPAVPSWVASSEQTRKQQKLCMHATIKIELQKVPFLTSPELRKIQIPVLSTKISALLEQKEYIMGTWLCHKKKTYNVPLGNVLQALEKYDLPPLLVNKVVLQQTHSFVYLLSMMAEWSWDRDLWLTKPQILSIWLLKNISLPIFVFQVTNAFCKWSKKNLNASDFYITI